MKRHTWYRLLACAAIVLVLAGCKAPAGHGGKERSKPAASDSPQVSATQAPEGKLLKGVINRIDSYLILLTDDEVYQTMELGEGVSMDGFAEGDRVEATYTGVLNSPEADPVIIAIQKEAS